MNIHNETQMSNETDNMNSRSNSLPKSNFFKTLSIISFAVSIIFFYLGFHKMFVYKADINRYVGADAYNYIINAAYSTSFFVLAIGFILSGLLLIIIHILKNKYA